MSDSEKDYTRKDIREFLRQGDSLEEADLRKGQLMGANLPKQNLRGADLQGANLQYANLAGVMLEGANLQNANLTGSYLSGANLSKANLEGATLTNTDFVRAILQGASFKRATLLYASLRAANITDADFTGADLQQANLRGAKGCLATSIKLTERFFDQIGKGKNAVPADVIRRLEALKNKEYWDDPPSKPKKAIEKVFEDLEKEIGDGQVDRYRAIFMKHAYASHSRKFDNAKMKGANILETGMDQQELQAVGAEIDFDLERGWRTKVFNFFEVEEHHNGLLGQLFKRFRRR